MYSAYLLEVEVLIRSGWRAPLFTGKLVKSLLIDANPRLKEAFEKSSGSEPKLVHITPLYESVDGKVRCVYSQARWNGAGWEARWVRIDGRYWFYIGLVEAGTRPGPGAEDIFRAVADIGGRHVFSGHAFDVELLRSTSIDVASVARGLVQGLKGGRGVLRVVFSSPTLLRDPFRSSRFKSLVPVPANIFSTPLYTLLYLSGRLSQRGLRALSILMHRLFSEAHTLYDTTRKAWVYYERGKNPIPAVTGYVNLHLNQEYYEKYSSKYQLGELLEEVFKTMTALGTGTSRAAGFGHTALSTAQDHPRRSREMAEKKIQRDRDRPSGTRIEMYTLNQRSLGIIPEDPRTIQIKNL